MKVTINGAVCRNSKDEKSLPFASGRRKLGAGSFAFRAPSGTPASRSHDESSRSVWMSSVREPLKVSAEASIGVLTGRPFETSSPILVLPPTVSFAALVRVRFLHGDRAFWKTKIQLWNDSR
jgi:hypothetical protein